MKKSDAVVVIVAIILVLLLIPLLMEHSCVAWVVDPVSSTCIDHDIRMLLQ